MACHDHKYEPGAYGVCRRCGGEKPEAWVVGMLRQDGTVATVWGSKRYPNEDFARAAALDRQREKPFMSFTAVRV